MDPRFVTRRTPLPNREGGGRVYTQNEQKEGGQVMLHHDAAERIESLLGESDEKQARSLLDSVNVRDHVDASLHLRLGRAAEALWDLRRATLEYNLSLRDDPDQPEVLLHLGRLRHDQGSLRRAERAYRRFLDLQPRDPTASVELGEILEASGRHQEAQLLYADCLDEKDDQRVREASLRLERTSGIVSAGEVGETGEGGANRDEGQILPRDADTVAMSHLFAGREGVYARQWKSSTGRHGYTPIHEAFTPVVARNHLLGAYTVGIYPVRMDNTVLFMAFDLDVAQFALNRKTGAEGTRGLASLLRQVQGMACRLVEAAAAVELPAYIEDSGWKGRHVWIFFDSPVPAAAARRLARLVIETTRPPPPEVTVEVFPKQSRVKPQKLGNLIKLPLGVHRVTGRRCLFLDPEDRPVPDQLAWMQEATRVPRERVRSILESQGCVQSLYLAHGRWLWPGLPEQL